MDPDIVLAKLESLRRCVGRIQEKAPAHVELLKTDYDLQDIISGNLKRAVQISVDIATHILSDTDTEPPQTMGEVFLAFSAANIISEELAERLRKAVGFRNIAVYEYESINWEIVYSTCTINIEDFRSYAANVLKYLGISD